MNAGGPAAAGAALSLEEGHQIILNTARLAGVSAAPQEWRAASMTQSDNPQWTPIPAARGTSILIQFSRNHAQAPKARHRWPTRSSFPSSPTRPASPASARSAAPARMPWGRIGTRCGASTCIPTPARRFVAQLARAKRRRGYPDSPRDPASQAAKGEGRWGAALASASAAPALAPAWGPLSAPSRRHPPAGRAPSCGSRADRSPCAPSA